MTALLEIKDLHVAYGKVEAVRGVGLRMQPGQIVTVIGPNGAGKTTLLAAAAHDLRARYSERDLPFQNGTATFSYARERRVERNRQRISMNAGSDTH